MRSGGVSSRPRMRRVTERCRATITQDEPAPGATRSYAPYIRRFLVLSGSGLSQLASVAVRQQV